MRLPWKKEESHLRPHDDRVTLGLAALALATAGTVFFGHVARMARRRVKAPEAPQETFLGATGHATLDSATVLTEGYVQGPRSERVLFNMLSGFLGAFAVARILTWGIRRGWWPTGNLSFGDLHVHHFVPGILMSFASGGAALMTSNSKLEDALAVPFGVGVGLTFDEAALLLDLDDVYWSKEGLLSIQVSLGATALLGATILGLRILNRGEHRAEEQELIPHATAIHVPAAGLMQP